MPSNKCEGGFDPQLAAETLIRPCVPFNTVSPAISSPQAAHFDAPVSRILVYLPSFVRVLFRAALQLWRVFPGREAGADPGVRRSGSDRAGGNRFGRRCGQEGGLQKQVSSKQNVAPCTLRTRSRK